MDYNEHMSTYIDTLKFSILFFPVIALIISIPFFIWAYRKYGSFTLLRALILYSFSFYLLTAYFLVILPLPTFSEVATMSGPIMDLKPGSFIVNYMKDRTLISILEPVFNLLIMVPLGMYARYYFRYSWKKTLVLAFFISLFFELTQLTGLYGIYPRPYRLFSLDDLMFNSLGGLIGFWIAPLFMKFLPSKERIDERSYEKGERVSLLRRAVALLIDYFAISVVVALISYGLNIAGLPALGLEQDAYSVVMYIAGVFIYFILLCYFCKGRTIGKAVVRIRVVRIDKENERPGLWSLIKRYVILYYFILPTFILLSHLLGSTGTAPSSQLDFILGEIVVIFSVCILFIANFIYALFARKHRLIYESMSGTKVISTIKKNN